LSACLRTLVPTLRTLVPTLRTLVPFLGTIVLVFENSPLADLTVGRSGVRQRILALLMDSASGRLHLREIQRRAGTSPGTASRELAKLVAAGLVEREAEGNQVYFRASTSPFATMLRSLLVAMPDPEFKPRPKPLSRAKPEPSVAAPPAPAAPMAPTLAAPMAPALAPSPAKSEESRPVAAQEVPPVSGEVAVASSPDASEGAATGATNRVIRPGSEVEGWSAPPLAATTSRQEPSRQEPAIAPVGAAADAGPAAGTSSIAADASPAPGTRPPISPPTSPVRAEPETTPAPSASGESTTSPDPLGLLVAARLARSLLPIYGKSLRGVYLYGARASGPTPVDRDVETIIVLDRIERYGEELERTSNACASLSHELKLVVSRVFVSEATWNGDTDGVPPRVRGEAVAA